MTQRRTSRAAFAALALLLAGAVIIAVAGFPPWGDEPAEHTNERASATPAAPEPTDHHADAPRQRAAADQTPPATDPASATTASPPAQSLAETDDDTLIDKHGNVVQVPDLTQVGERPTPLPVTPEMLRQRQQDALDLVTRNIDRLEAEERAARARGDEQVAERNRIRVERLRARQGAITRALAEAEAGAASDPSATGDEPER
ncbi:MAG: hypothetical protein Tsb0020_48330 [Haliangiales bacterium]